MPSYFIEIEGCYQCEDYTESRVGAELCWQCKPSPREIDGEGVPDWCPRNAKPAEYIRKLEANQTQYDELKALYLDALECNEMLEAQLRTLEDEYRQVLAKLPKGD